MYKYILIKTTLFCCIMTIVMEVIFLKRLASVLSIRDFYSLVLQASAYKCFRYTSFFYDKHNYIDVYLHNLLELRPLPSWKMSTNPHALQEVKKKAFILSHQTYESILFCFCQAIVLIEGSMQHSSAITTKKSTNWLF